MMVSIPSNKWTNCFPVCILFIAIDQHPDYPLIICANRDEYYQRPTLPAHQWNSGVIAGKDLQAGGSWLGVNPLGQFAAVTNLRTAHSEDTSKLSRGELVTGALAIDSKINQHWLEEHSRNYGGFNLVYGSAEQLACYNSQLKSQQILSKGFHAVCNGHMDDTWPKMAKGKQALEKQIACGKPIQIDYLFELLIDPTQAPDDQLPDTGVSYEWEKRLSSIFIRSEGYGTRASSIVLYRNNGAIDFFENSFDDQGQLVNKITFTIDKNTN